MRRLLIAFVVLYQRCISPFCPPACRFVPTCSEYAIEAIQNRGVIQGLCFAAWRVLRCNPFHPGGYDPAPQPRHPRPAKEKMNSHGF